MSDSLRDSRVTYNRNGKYYDRAQQYSRGVGTNTRELTRQFSTTSRVLRRKPRQVRRAPLRVGDDPLGRRLIMPIDNVPSVCRAKGYDELMNAYWCLLHTLTFLVPDFLDSQNMQRREQGLANIVWFFDNLGTPGAMANNTVPAKSRTKSELERVTQCPHCQRHWTEEMERLSGHSVRGLVYQSEDPLRLARWLHNVHNNVHALRKQFSGLDDSKKREPVPWERTLAYYGTRTLSASRHAPFVVEAWLFTMFRIKLRRDFGHTHLVQVDADTEVLNANYMKRIYYKYRPISPHGKWNPWWTRLHHISDSSNAIVRTERATGAVGAHLMQALMVVGGVFNIIDPVHGWGKVFDEPLEHAEGKSVVGGVLAYFFALGWALCYAEALHKEEQELMQEEKDREEALKGKQTLLQDVRVNMVEA